MSPEMHRSPALMRRDNSALIVIDIQERLLPSIPNREMLVWNTGRLIDGARALGVPVHGTEQYPEGLGPTLEGLRERLGAVGTKRRFSCVECSGLFARLQESGIENLLLAGIETHVCILQTALDLTAAGFHVLLAVDATGSRNPVDRDTALRRMESMGVTLTTAETTLFEWCETSAAPEFRTISRLVRQTAPEAAAT